MDQPWVIICVVLLLVIALVLIVRFGGWSWLKASISFHGLKAKVEGKRDRSQQQAGVTVTDAISRGGSIHVEDGTGRGASASKLDAAGDIKVIGRESSKDAGVASLPDSPSSGVPAAPSINFGEMNAGGNIGVKVEVLVGGAGSPEVAQLFENAKDLLNAHQVEPAVRILESINTSYNGQLAKPQQFRWLSLRGHAYRIIGNADDAARCFFQAVDLVRDTDDAKILEIQAYSMKGNHHRAFELADKLIETASGNPRVWGLWLQIAPYSFTSEQLESRIPEHYRDEPEVTIALSLSALRRQDYGMALKYGKAALEKNKSPYAKAFTAQAMICLTAEKCESVEPTDEGKKLFREAVDLAEDAIKGFAHGSAPDDLADTHLAAATGHTLLNELQAAREHLDAARRLDPTSDRLVMEFVHWHHANRDEQSALEELEKAVKTDRSDVIWLYYAQSLADRKGPDDRDVALGVFEQLYGRIDSVHLRFRESVVNGLATLLLESDKFDRAQQVLKDSGANHLNGVLLAVLEGELALALGKKDQALEIAKRADAISREADRRSTRRLSRLFENAGDSHTSFTVLKRIVVPSHYDASARRAVELAVRFHDEDFIVEYCEAHRNAGGSNIQLLDLELETRVALSPREAVTTIQSILAAGKVGASEQRFLRLRLSHLGHRLEMPELVEKSPTNLPHVGEITAKQASIVVLALRWTERPIAAVELAYEIVRRFPDDPDALEAMIKSLGFGLGDIETKFESPDVVDVGTAFSYRDNTTGSTQTYVIEADETVKTVLNEISSKSDLATHAIGKRVGDEFDIDIPMKGRRSCTITSIQNKLLHRFQYAVKRLPAIPGQVAIAEFKVRETENGKVDFSELLKSLEGQRDREEIALRVYREHLIPIHMLAKQVDGHIAFTLDGILQRGDTRFRCCDGNDIEFQETQNPLASATGLVLEPSALATFVVLDWRFNFRMSEPLFRLGIPVYVSELALDKLRGLANRVKPGRERIGVERIGTELFPTLSPADSTAVAHSQVEKLIDELRSNAVIVNGMSSMSGVPHEMRQVFKVGFGRSATASCLIAKQKGALLVCDDLSLSATAKSHLGIPRVWTQILAGLYRERELVDDLWEDRLSWCLLRMQFRFVRLRPSAAINAGKENGWKAANFPLRDVLDVFADNDVEADGIFNTAFHTLREVWSQPLLCVQAQEVTLRLLDRIWRHTDRQKIVAALFQAAPTMFGPIDIFTGKNLQAVIAVFMRTANQSGIIVP